MLSELPAYELPLSEDAATVRLLIEGMYDANMIVDKHTVGLLLELSRKYAVADINLNCSRFLCAVPMTTRSLPCDMALACEYGINHAVDRFHDFIAAGDSFLELTQCVPCLLLASKHIHMLWRPQVL